MSSSLKYIPLALAFSYILLLLPLLIWLLNSCFLVLAAANAVNIVNEAAQWQLFFVMFSALAMRVNLDNESLQDRKAFDLLMLSIQGFAPVIAIVAKAFSLMFQRKDKEFEDELEGLEGGRGGGVIGVGLEVGAGSVANKENE